MDRSEFLTAGGHHTIVSTGDGKIVKVADPTEITFYKELEANYPDLCHLVPKFYGTAGDSIILQDLTAGYTRPCVMDVKIGANTIGPQKSLPRRMRAYLRDRVTTSHRYGFRLCGLTVYDAEKGTMQHITRSKTEFLARRMHKYLQIYCADSDRRAAFLEGLENIRAWFRQNERVAFLASSVLFVYEGDPAVANPLPPRVWMIDLAHSRALREGERVDLNYLFGLDRLGAAISGIKKP